MNAPAPRPQNGHAWGWLLYDLWCGNILDQTFISRARKAGMSEEDIRNHLLDVEFEREHGELRQREEAA